MNNITNMLTPITISHVQPQTSPDRQDPGTLLSTPCQSPWRKPVLLVRPKRSSIRSDPEPPQTPTPRRKLDLTCNKSPPYTSVFSVRPLRKRTTAQTPDDNHSDTDLEMVFSSSRAVRRSRQRHFAGTGATAPKLRRSSGTAGTLGSSWSYRTGPSPSPRQCDTCGEDLYYPEYWLNHLFHYDDPVNVEPQDL